MLIIKIPGKELFDDEKEEFTNEEPIVLEMEHSLVSLSKWESKWKKPFLGEDSKTDEETLGYVIAMTVTLNIPPEVYSRLTRENLAAINDYINDKMTATWFNERSQQDKSREIITSELIYHWMSSLKIPMECEKWHLNRLFVRLKIAGIKSSPPKKLSPTEAAMERRRINEENRKRFNSNG